MSKAHPSLPYFLFPGRFIKAKLRPSSDDSEPPEKRCPHCRDWWPADREFFYPIQLKTTGYTLRSWCKVCELERQRQYREAHPYRPRLEIFRKRRRRGILVIVVYKGRHYAALYHLGADTSKPAVYRDLRERGYGSAKGAFFQAYDPTAGCFLWELKRLKKRFTPPPQRKPSDDHVWRVADRNSYLLYQAKHGRKAA